MGFYFLLFKFLGADAAFASKIHILTASEENASNLSSPPSKTPHISAVKRFNGEKWIIESLRNPMTQT
ncbi:hypothetical protein DN92_05415 [Polynucleobacter arcticus]|uniref:Uncharacterized protein n=1 Tax=Polynucleobacter arcticus TaxID=1743165 RepID=A0A6M9PMH4_9BURK|nr:hypothetical protein DN92_05415 [Polynucleobacter arcticus]